MTYLSSKATYEVDPTGYLFEVPLKEAIDPLLGWYKGVDEAIWERSGKTHRHFFLNSAIHYPMSNCGCFEGIAFYIPQVDALGLIVRRYSGATPLGVNFSKLAGTISGGQQNHGFKAFCVPSARRPAFMCGDGGWDRIVWVCKCLKEEIASIIPEEVYDKIATEEDCIDPADIKKFLIEKKHPVIEKYWENGEPQAIQVPFPGQSYPEFEERAKQYGLTKDD